MADQERSGKEKLKAFARKLSRERSKSKDRSKTEEQEAGPSRAAEECEDQQHADASSIPEIQSEIDLEDRADSVGQASGFTDDFVFTAGHPFGAVLLNKIGRAHV